MDFHDVRLSDEVEKGAVGGPNFLTTVLTLASGHEERNIEWIQARSSFDLAYGIMKKEHGTADGFEEILEFFYARLGAAHSFRFKDWSDYQIARQSIGTTDASTTDFNIFKRYSSGAFFHDRTNILTIGTNFLAWVNNVSVTTQIDAGPGADNVRLNTNSNSITLGSNLSAQTGTDIEIQGEFDIPVRFNTDNMQVQLETFEAGGIPNVPIIEVRGEGPS